MPPAEAPASTMSSAVAPPAESDAAPPSRTSPTASSRPAARATQAAHLAAEAPPDANLSPLPPNSGFHPTGLRDLPLNLLEDQRNFFTSPLRTRASDLDLLLPFAGVSAILASGVDRGIESHLPTSSSVISRSKSFSNYGAAAMAGGVAGAWMLGEIRHDDHMTEAGFLSGEAAISTL
ncbi:MAG TPA: hypothetical protein VE998_09445, partial [Terriglobales bacterium]|nr:hypothetical protein [Terriglobales bacterium]